jgi:hypothetical protein
VAMGWKMFPEGILITTEFVIEATLIVVKRVVIGAEVGVLSESPSVRLLSFRLPTPDVCGPCVLNEEIVSKIPELVDAMTTEVMVGTKEVLVDVESTFPLERIEELCGNEEAERAAEIGLHTGPDKMADVK